MGYLNNQVVTVDAILTKKGRQLLAQNDGSFRITQFALADDEVDYELWNAAHPLGSDYYGIIIENMPIVEAVTDESYSLKYKLFNYQSTTLGGSIYFPTGEFSGVNLTSGILKLYTLENITKDFRPLKY